MGRDSSRDELHVGGRRVLAGRWVVAGFAALAMCSCQPPSSPRDPAKEEPQEQTETAVAPAEVVAAAAPQRVEAVQAAERPMTWQYSAQRDEVQGAWAYSACLYSQNTVRLDWPYREQLVELCVRQHPRWGQDVTIRLTAGGQFLCDGYRGCTVSVRFDDGAPSSYSAAEPADLSTDILFIVDDAQFVAALTEASRVVVEAQFYQAGAQVLMFDVGDLEWPMSAERTASARFLENAVCIARELHRNPQGASDDRRRVCPGP